MGSGGMGAIVGSTTGTGAVVGSTAMTGAGAGAGVGIWTPAVGLGVAMFPAPLGHPQTTDAKSPLSATVRIPSPLVSPSLGARKQYEKESCKDTGARVNVALWSVLNNRPLQSPNVDQQASGCKARMPMRPPWHAILTVNEKSRPCCMHSRPKKVGKCHKRRNSTEILLHTFPLDFLCRILRLPES